MVSCPSSYGLGVMVYGLRIMALSFAPFDLVTKSCDVAGLLDIFDGAGNIKVLDEGRGIVNSGDGVRELEIRFQGESIRV